MTPEEREQMLQRMSARGFDPSATGAERGGDRRAGRGNAPPTPPQAAPQATRASGATTIDALFGPLPVIETRGRVWLYVDKQLKPVQLRLGISDGQATELIEGDLEPGIEVVTNVTTGAETRPALQGGFPFLGQPGRGGFPGGPGGFGGNRGGGGNNGGGRGR